MPRKKSSYPLTTTGKRSHHKPDIEQQTSASIRKAFIALDRKETKPELVAEVKPEVVAEAKPEVVAEVKPEVVAEAKPNEDEVTISGTRRKRRKQGIRRQTVLRDEDQDKQIVLQFLSAMSQAVVSLTKEPATALPDDLRDLIEPPTTRTLQRLAPEIREKIDQVSDPILILTGFSLWANTVYNVMAEKRKQANLPKPVRPIMPVASATILPVVELPSALQKDDGL